MAITRIVILAGPRGHRSWEAWKRGRSWNKHRKSPPHWGGLVFGSLRYITVRGGHAAMRSATHRMSCGSSVSKNSNASAVTREAEEHWGRY